MASNGALDLKDAIAKQPILSKSAYRERVHHVPKSKQAQTSAANCALGLRKVSKEVVQKGAMRRQTETHSSLPCRSLCICRNLFTTAGCAQAPDPKSHSAVTIVFDSIVDIMQALPEASPPSPIES